MIRVLLVDDHRIMREGIASLLDSEDDMEVVEQADNGRESIALAKKLKPDIIVMDIAMPDLNGADATRQVLHDNPNIRVIALSMHSDRQFVATMLEAGASGYLVKSSAYKELRQAIRTVMDGHPYLSSEVAEVVVEDYVRNLPSEQKTQTPELTPREREVLQLIAEGHSTKKIAQQLYLSAKTVGTHRRNIMEKLGVNSIAELTKYAISHGLTSLES
jgi:DNA-binding NarL/FixJ family response regulator